ncbi:MAG: hypothetical protein DME44_12190 [Verrucomicrobia bacterium]|nr:MAG: hypothetical protein DME44_12190 [Verrucomicrobiota bacterium]
MTTFEEKWTAWIDDELTGRELEEFLASLPDRAAAQAEKQNAKQVGSLLREQAMALSNADFFSHQLRGRLDRENAPIRSEPDAIRTGWWTIRRLLWGGITQILESRVDPTVSPNATISMFEKKDDHVTVLWVDGLQSLPPEYAAK